ncbi:MAG: carboxymuconolactone decarboxylase family protein [Polymorphobacter sp.]
MPTIPYLPADLAEPAELVASVRARRGGTLLNLDRILLHSPVFTEGWGAFMGRLRTATAISPRLRELAICAVAVESAAGYELYQHLPELIRAGASAAEVAAVQSGDLRGIGDTERTIIVLATEITRDHKPSPASFAAARAALGSDAAMVEMVGTIAAYAMVSRILLTFDIQPEV